MDIKDNPLVSVILITYNSERYVVDALESIKSQLWKNIELIISDDGSSDQTVELCADWIVDNKSRFAMTKLITVSNNTGIPANCNRGLRAATGDWIKMISGDDILICSAITDNLTFADKHPEACFIASDVREIDENGTIIRDCALNEGLIHFSELPTVQKQMKAYCRWPVFLNTPTFFCKRNMIEEGDNFDENYRIYEDMIMVMKSLERGYKLYYLKKTTVAYRLHPKAVSRSASLNEMRYKEAFNIFKKYRSPHLSILNPIDLSVYYESWLTYKYKGINGVRGSKALRKLSLNYWYMKSQGIKSY